MLLLTVLPGGGGGWLGGTLAASVGWVEGTSPLSCFRHTGWGGDTLPGPAGSPHMIAGWLSGQGHHFLGDDCSTGYGAERRVREQTAGRALV